MAMNTLFETPQEMRVLTVWQPWASLLVHRIKLLETRPGPTSWTAEKGIYLIHAAKKWSKDQVDICMQEPFRTELDKLGYWFIQPYFWRKTFQRTNLPLGCIIGSIEVTECQQIIHCRNDIKIAQRISKTLTHYTVKDPEYSFGDYREGRYAWLTQNPRVLKTPIPYKGGQGYYQRFTGDTNQLIYV